MSLGRETVPPVMAAPIELGKLRAELRAAGVFDHCELRSWLKLVVLAVVLAATLAGIAELGWVGAMFLVPVAAVVTTTISMMGHEGSHRSFSSSPTRNALLVYLTVPLFAGLGALYWHHKHDRLHHGHPNVEGVDPDIRPFPFTSSRGDHDSCGRTLRWFQRWFQRWLFWPMTTFMPVGMRRSSLIYLLRYPRKREWRWRLDAACIAAHYVGWVAVPVLVWGPLALLTYLAIWAIVGVFLALVFAPAHMGLPIVTEPNHDWVHQLDTTRDLELPRAVSFFFVGLDYQVEHHLFPKLPHQRLPEARRITAAWCRQHGLNYQSLPYLTALVASARFMAQAWSRPAQSDSVPAAAVINLRGSPAGVSRSW